VTPEGHAYHDHRKHCLLCPRGGDCPEADRLYKAWEERLRASPSIKAPGLAASAGAQAKVGKAAIPYQFSSEDGREFEVLWSADDQPVSMIFQGRIFKLVEEE
jgi:hypothetical protein